MSLVGQKNHRYRFSMENRQAPGHFYDVQVDFEAAPGRAGGGTVHHIAFRTENDVSQARWQTDLRAAGFGVTDVRDRNYFRSIYFRTPGGVLFEIATDPPGFTVDETVEELGASLKLPKQYESMRDRIESHLPPLRTSPFRYIFKASNEADDKGETLVSLHGTGGDERDLVGFARKLAPAAAVISPRGRVTENGLSRFFERLAPNIFDDRAVVRRANELADFVLTKTGGYGRDPLQLTALGYSNGANIAAAVILLRSEVFSRAVLLRPMLPLQKPPVPDLTGKAILILAGEHDSVIPAESTERLGNLFVKAGANVVTHKMSAGHEITAGELDIAARWLSDAYSRKRDLPHEMPLETLV